MSAVSLAWNGRKVHTIVKMDASIDQKMKQRKIDCPEASANASHLSSFTAIIHVKNASVLEGKEVYLIWRNSDFELFKRTKWLITGHFFTEFDNT